MQRLRPVVPVVSELPRMQLLPLLTSVGVVTNGSILPNFTVRAEYNDFEGCTMPVWIVRGYNESSEFVVGVYSREDDARDVCAGCQGGEFWVTRINLDVFPEWFGK